MKRWSVLRGRLALLVLGAVALVVLVEVGTFSRGGGSTLAAAPALSPEEQRSLARAEEMSQAFATVVRLVKPAVVNIHVERVQVVTRRESPLPFGNDDFFRYFFGEPGPQQQPRQRRYEFRQPIAGSGVIVDAAHGYILTNNHMVEGAEKISVKLADGRESEGKTVGADPATDLAVIRIQAENLAEAHLGDSDALQVGEWVIAIGNPFGLDLTVTSGVVSAKGRSNLRTATYEDYIQTDAAINPGNSGGPLINLRGEVVGINSIILSPTGTFAGYGFAIPSNMAKEVMGQLVAKGSVTRGYLGFVVQELTPELAEGLGLPKDTKGVAVPQVAAGSAAEKAGLKPNDVVVKFDGKHITSANQLLNLVAQTAPGASITITVLRDGKEVDLKATVGERPREEAVAGRQAPPSKEQALGFSLTDLTSELAQQLGLTGDRGVVVTEVEDGSPAAEAGLQAGDLIMAVNRQSVPDVDAYRKVLAGLGSAKRLVLLVKSHGASHFVLLRLP
jgi:serine protease Do